MRGAHSAAAFSLTIWWINGVTELPPEIQSYCVPAH